ncbi:CPBP family intramembrane glutamic endopeptidase [Pelagicoccus sp. SDUM812003]|uniref:CPBP family intramembrane glutamic endopeptidase n=1 Tax=Pelagicoccus sp. SDUM812003 TaxID=3041267 RepID=UPI00280CC1F6|nr:CPBP family intramembrane glutamic endopeptidase [Pelagicoccus sp. SDUM812003]MDQ8201702.1 CPBP family intramembrane metalloprotease [Pelagicoccus sp. SDUM812003]
MAGLLFAVLAALSFYACCGESGIDGRLLTIVYVAMWLPPFLFLSTESRRAMGFHLPQVWLGLPISLIAGAVLAFICYFVGDALYGHGEENWFMSVGYRYLSDQRIVDLPQHLAFIAFTVPALIASPVGEELFFRGVIHHAIEERTGLKIATVATSALFAFTQLAHHGIHRTNNGLEILPVSGFLWFLLMFVAGVVFTIARHRYGSILASVFAHAGFNLAMNTTIFYALFVQ